MKLSCKVKIKNPQGLHARPATAIAKILQKSKSSVFFSYKKERINARSIMSILMLAAAKNTLLTIDVEGEDAQETMEGLVNGFETQFGEA
jgi:phosphocarrier protein HPr